MSDTELQWSPEMPETPGLYVVRGQRQEKFPEWLCREPQRMMKVVEVHLLAHSRGHRTDLDYFGLEEELYGPLQFAKLADSAAAYVAAKDKKHEEWLAKPLTRSEWLTLLMRCQDGQATCMFVLAKIERELDMAAARPAP